MLKLLRLAALNLSADEQKELEGQARGARKLLKTMRKSIELKLASIDSELMSESLFKDVNSYSHKVANLMGAKRQLCLMLNLLEEDNYE